ncbi:MAG: hypothetical protein ACTHK0_00830 [Ginsengibacter sp.]
MKTTIIRSLALPLAASFLATHSPAQNTHMKNEVAQVSYYQKVNKTPFSTNAQNAITSTATVPYNQKVFQEFQKKFLDAINVSWSLEHNGTYHAFFRKDGCLNAILFDKKGKMVYLINYLSPDQLPANVKNLMNDSFEEYKITNAVKVFDDNRTLWVLTLTGVTHWIKVVAEDGEIQQVDKYKLAN